MAYSFLDLATTPSVRAVQAAADSRRLWSVAGQDRQFDRFTATETGFIAERESFYMATVSETGWPYVQHRGGPKGFLKVLDETTLAFPDYRGNRQYLSLGNLSADDRASLILVDYPRRARLKILGHVELLPLNTDMALQEAVSGEPRQPKPERVLKLRLRAFDWNCPQHITPRFTEAEVAVATEPLRLRLASLEAENVHLRDQLAQTRE